MRVLLIRHGQSAWQTGESASLDAPLTELGARQAQLVGRHLAVWPDFDASRAWLAASSLARARATAAAIVERAAPHAAIQVDADLGEAPFRLADEDGSQPGSPCSERYRAFYDRAVACWGGFLDRLTRPDPPCVVLVTHNGFIKCVLRSLMKRPDMTLKVANGSITEVRVARSEIWVQAIGCIGHLPEAWVTH